MISFHGDPPAELIVSRSKACYVLLMNPSPHADDFWLRLAEAEVQTTLCALPDDLRDRLQDVPVLLDDIPGRHLLDDGLPDDLLGIFEGPCYGERTMDNSSQPPTITLFIANLRDETHDDPDAFRQEVRTTLLHEIGHYLGLGEDDLAARDLE
jgi:predicted Zn-dependent protease with MMP-like domain